MRTHKRIFLGLFLLLSVLLLLFLLAVGYYIKSPDAPVFRYSFTFIMIALTLFTAIAFFSTFIMFVSLLRGKAPSFLNAVAGKAVMVLFPLILYLGRLFRITQDKIQQSFIEVNNRLVEVRRLKILPGELLILVPHCLQNNNCQYKITRDPFNCRQCGRCSVFKLLRLACKWQVNIQVVTGGTLARQAVEAFKPRCVVAVACERDLTSGIIDSFPLPVWGLLNERPHGPCYNTSVSVQKLEEAIGNILN